MNPGGEAADTLVKIYLSGVEMMIRLSGSALKNMLALTLALARENKKVSGKINLAKMLRETRDLRTFTMTPAQYKAFKKLAKKQGILFAAVTDKDERGKLVDVILPATELDRANLLFQRILYDPNLGPDSPEPPQNEKEHWWQRLFRGREKEAERDAPPNPEPVIVTEEQPPRLQNPTRPAPEALPEHWEERWPDIQAEPPEVIIMPSPVIPLGIPAPEGEARIEESGLSQDNYLKDVQERETQESKSAEERREVTVVPPQPVLSPEPQTHDGPPRENAAAQPEPVRNDALPSRPVLPDTSGKSPLPSGNTDTRTTRADSERPSVLKRLEAYRSQLEKKDGAAPEKGREAREKPARGGRSAVGKRPAKTGSPIKNSRQMPKPVR